MSEQRFYIASLKHTSKGHEHITFWGRDHRGYTMVFGDHMGTYSLDEARQLNDGVDCIAVPIVSITGLMSPEPYCACNGKAVRFYDQRGPVIDNTRANWNRLIAVSLPDGRQSKPRPEVFTRARRSFAMSEAAA